MSRKISLEFPDFWFQQISPKVEAELKILGIASFGFESSFVREKEIVEAISYGIIEEGGNGEKPFRDQKDSLHQNLQFQVLSQVYGGKIADGKY